MLPIDNRPGEVNHSTKLVRAEESKNEENEKAGKIGRGGFEVTTRERTGFRAMELGKLDRVTFFANG